MKLKAAPGIVEIYLLFATLFLQLFYRFSTEEIVPKTFSNGTFIDFSAIWSRLSSISSYLTIYTMIYTSLTFSFFVLTKGSTLLLLCHVKILLV